MLLAFTFTLALAMNAVHCIHINVQGYYFGDGIGMWCTCVNDRCLMLSAQHPRDHQDRQDCRDRHGPRYAQMRRSSDGK